jgi:hypothetical protein
MVKGVNIGVRDRRHLHPADGGQDVGANLVAIAALGRWPLARNVIRQETTAEVGHRRRGAALSIRPDRVGPAVDLAFEALGLLAGRSRTPFGVSADRDSPLSTVGSPVVIQDEGATASRGYTTAEPADFVVVGNPIAAGRDRQLGNRPIGEAHGPVSVMCPYTG